MGLARAADHLVETLARDVLHDHEVDVVVAANGERLARLGWRQRWERSISRRNRTRAFSSSSAFRGGSTLMATRSSRSLTARNTLPIPPAPSGRSSR